MKRADKIKMSQQIAAEAAAADTRDQKQRDDARREWGQVRKETREAFLARKDWMAVLNAYREKEDAFYTDAERDRMCKQYTEELLAHAIR